MQTIEVRYTKTYTVEKAPSHAYIRGDGRLWGIAESTRWSEIGGLPKEVYHQAREIMRWE